MYNIHSKEHILTGENEDSKKKTLISEEHLKQLTLSKICSVQQNI